MEHETKHCWGTVMWRPGALTEAGEWSLIHGRHAALQQEFGWSVTLAPIWRKTGSQGIPKHWQTTGYHVSPVCYRRRLFGQLRGAYRATQAMLAVQPSVVLFTGGFSGLWQGSLQRAGIRTLWDVHGAVQAEQSEFGSEPGSFVRHKPWTRARTGLTEWCMRRCDGVLVVTPELGDLIGPQVGSQKVFVVPCASNTHLRPEELQLHRERWRRLWQIPADAVVMVHVGGLGVWQATDIYLRDFPKIVQALPTAWFLCLTSSKEEARRAMQALPEPVRKQTRIDCVSAAHLAQALCAADAGLLLRHTSVTNRVAFPNKIDEYLAAGLGILTTLGLPAAARLVQSNQVQGSVAHNMSLDECGQFLCQLGKSDSSARLERWQACQQARKQHAFSTTLKPVVAWASAVR